MVRQGKWKGEDALVLVGMALVAEISWWYGLSRSSFVQPGYVRRQCWRLLTELEGAILPSW